MTALALLMLTASAMAQDTSAVVARARTMVAAQQLQAANETLSTALRREPGDVEAWTLLGEVQSRQHLLDDAMQSYETALKLRPGSSAAVGGEVHAAIENALTYRDAGDQELALACLMRAQKFAPDAEELLVDVGIQAGSMQLYQEAEATLAHAHELQPGDARALYALAHVELTEQKTALAEEHLRAYLAMKPDDATAHYGLGHLLHMEAKDEAAKAELQRSIELQPHQSESYYELGEIALDEHRDEDARREFERVLSADARHGGALAGMGILAYRVKDYAGAERLLTQATVYAPDYVAAHRYLGMTLAHLGQQERADRESALAQQLTDEQSKLSHGYFLVKQP